MILRIRPHEITDWARLRLPFCREVYDFVREVVLRCNEDHLTLSAAAISFFTIISLIPLILFAVMMPAYFIPVQDVEAQVHALCAQLPATLGIALGEQVSYFIHHRDLLFSLVIVVGLWTGSQVFLNLDEAINIVWRSHYRRNFWKRRLLAFLMVVLVGTLMIGAAALTNLLRVLDHFQVTLLGYRVQEISWLFTTLISVVVPILLVSAIFAAIYCILPARTVTLRSVIPGAAAAGVGWSISLHLFSVYASRFATYQFIYGSLGGTVLMMFWLYFSALILLLGAEASAVYHHRLLRAGDPEERQVEVDANDLPALDDPDLL